LFAVLLDLVDHVARFAHGESWVAGEGSAEVCRAGALIEVVAKVVEDHEDQRRWFTGAKVDINSVEIEGIDFSKLHRKFFPVIFSSIDIGILWIVLRWQSTRVRYKLATLREPQPYSL
jgi:hypothetical protein